MIYEKMLKEREVARNSGNYEEAREINHQIYEINYKVYQKLIRMPHVTAELATNVTNELIKISLKCLDESLEKGIELAILQFRGFKK